MTKTPYEGMWDFDGACAPQKREDGSWSSGQGETFTLGCFQWVLRSKAKTLKRGTVVYRIKGYSSDPQPAYDRAAEWCAKKNEASK